MNARRAHIGLRRSQENSIHRAGSFTPIHSTCVTRLLLVLLTDVLDQLLKQTGKHQERSSGGPRKVGSFISGSAEPFEEGCRGRFFQGSPEQFALELMQLRVRPAPLRQVPER